jgi:alpha-L-fucosidase 2
MIELLPALPAAWPNGSVSGLRTRGGLELEMGWNDGKLNVATIRSKRGGAAVVRNGETSQLVNLAAGEETTIQPTP